jgi:hypothetical protein
MQFRQHRSTLRESLDTAIEIDNSFDVLQDKVRELFPHIGDAPISVVHYTYDERLEQDVFTVFTNEFGVLGFTDEMPVADESTALFGNFILDNDFTNLIVKKNGVYVFDWEILKKHRGLSKHPDIINFLRDQEHLELGKPIKRSWESYDFSENISLLPEIITEEDGTQTFIGLDLVENSTRWFSICTSLDNKSDVIEKFVRILPLIAEYWCLLSIHRFDVGSRLPDVYTIQKDSKGKIKNIYLRGHSDMDGMVDWEQ